MKCMRIIRPQSKQPIPEKAKKVFSGKLFDIYQWQQKMFDGRTVTFEKAKRKSDTVNVLPVTDKGKIILCEQEQPGEIPFIGALGGRMDKQESPLEAAKRELLEESGLEAEKFVLLNAIQPSIKVDWVCYTFIAKHLKKVSEQRTDSGEKIKLIEVSFDEYLEIVTRSDYRDDEIALFLLKAKSDKDKMEQLRKLFSSQK